MIRPSEAAFSRSERLERRISRLTLLIGAAGAVVTAVALGPAAGSGVAVGAGLAWLNFRWLRGGLDAMVQLSVRQAGAEKPRISRWVWAKFFLRYVLIGIVVYVMISRFEVPVGSLLGGLLALGAATLAHSLYEVLGRRS